MRNLRAIRFGSWQHPRQITGACWDAGKDELLCTIGPTEANPSIELVRVIEGDLEITHETVTRWEVPSPSPDAPVDKILSLHHSSDTLTTTLVFSNGDVTIVRENGLENGESAHIELIGSMDDGNAAARWSPDEEILVVVTKAYEVMFMGRSLDPIAEVRMAAEDLQSSKHVSIGWGKKETQFQGRGARALRDPTIPEKVDEGVLSSLDDGSTTISWRGDGAYVAINTIQGGQGGQGGQRRVIRVYNREGFLDSVSEPVDGLEGALSWRPSGNLIAGIQRLPDRIDVVFFERNGLRHGQFSLRSASDKIELEWNSDSTVLAVIFEDKVQLWTTGNYHWYLKQEIPLSGGVRAWSWHPEKSLRMAAGTSESVVAAEYSFTTARGTSEPPSDFGAVAVIDGSTLKITPFRTANIPPPMSMFDLTVSGNVIDVAFLQGDSIIAILHTLGVDVYTWQVKNGRRVPPTLLSKTKLPESDMDAMQITQTTPLQICHSGPNEFCVVTMSFESKLHPATVNVSSGSIIWRDGIILPGTNSMAYVTDGYATQTGEMRGYVHSHTRNDLMIRDGACVENLPFKLPYFAPWVKVVPWGHSEVAIALSRSGQLSINSRILAKNCTSFLVTKEHLIFTTNNHLLKFVHLDAQPEADAADIEHLEVPADDPEIDERCRSIERGARLVTAVPTNMSLVLQMPRGNTETIYPRAMVLAGIRKLVDEKNYKRAFSYCRTQRVDMNLLYDHRPSQFLSNVDLFLEQLEDVSYIDLFLSSLREEDVTKAMYKDTKRPRTNVDETLGEENDGILLEDKSTNKVNRICDAILKALQENKSSNIQNIITAHVCKVPPALEDGLALVAKLMQEDESVAEQAVEHICFLVDVNRLYENALGLYSLDLALLVAQQSQKDPREYLPFVQSLHQMEDSRRRFTIDDHLGRRAKALIHLKELRAFEEAQSYIVKHSLYQDALKLYRYEADRLCIVTNLYAEYLEGKSQFRDAGLAYESLANFDKATVCYRAAGATCWQECLFVAQQQDPPLSGETLVELGSVLADALWEAKDYAAAAHIHEVYLNSLESAVKCLCKAYLFAEAFRLVTRNGRPDLLLTAVDTGITDALASSTEFLAECKAQLAAQVPRILELRRRAREDPLAFYEGERTGGVDLPDDVSIAASSRLSTSASLFTRYTGKGAPSVGTLGTGVSRATSKNRKREEKKRARGRKGTVYEEEYLVNSLRRLVDRVEGTKAEVQRLVVALLRRGMGERAMNLEALTEEVVEGCQKAVGSVFPVEDDKKAARVADGSEGVRHTGGDLVLQEALEARGISAEPPVISDFKRLALLG